MQGTTLKYGSINYSDLIIALQLYMGKQPETERERYISRLINDKKIKDEKTKLLQSTEENNEEQPRVDNKSETVKKTKEKTPKNKQTCISTLQEFIIMPDNKRKAEEVLNLYTKSQKRVIELILGLNGNSANNVQQTAEILGIKESTVKTSSIAVARSMAVYLGLVELKTDAQKSTLANMQALAEKKKLASIVAQNIQITNECVPKEVVVQKTKSEPMQQDKQKNAKRQEPIEILKDIPKLATALESTEPTKTNKEAVIENLAVDVKTNVQIARADAEEKMSKLGKGEMQENLEITDFKKPYGAEEVENFVEICQGLSNIYANMKYLSRDEQCALILAYGLYQQKPTSVALIRQNVKLSEAEVVENLKKAEASIIILCKEQKLLTKEQYGMKMALTSDQARQNIVPLDDNGNLMLEKLLKRAVDNRIKVKPKEDGQSAKRTERTIKTVSSLEARAVKYVVADSVKPQLNNVEQVKPLLPVHQSKKTTIETQQTNSVTKQHSIQSTVLSALPQFVGDTSLQTSKSTTNKEVKSERKSKNTSTTKVTTEKLTKRYEGLGVALTEMVEGWEHMTPLQATDRIYDSLFNLDYADQFILILQLGLYGLKEHSISEIAEFLGISEIVVSSKAKNAKTKLHVFMYNEKELGDTALRLKGNLLQQWNDVPLTSKGALNIYKLQEFALICIHSFARRRGIDCHNEKIIKYTDIESMLAEVKESFGE